jgi:hypothetical protein
MSRFSPSFSVHNFLLALFLASNSMSRGEGAVGNSTAPKVIVATGSQTITRAYQPQQGPRIIYPWKIRVTCTVFWIGELPSARNPTPNNKSSWDQNWVANYGGYDDPDPSNRIADYTTGDFRPKGFIPKLNPFYVALPYNDVIGHGMHKAEASRVIPWFTQMHPEPGKTVCKDRWIQIYNGSRSCYAQWEDCGPWETDDWEFVFGTKPPKTTQNGSAGIDLSPAIRDYLTLKSGDKVHWRFIEAAQVPQGPWKKYAPEVAAKDDPQLDSQRRYVENLRRLRDEEYLKKPLNGYQGGY